MLDLGGSIKKIIFLLTLLVYSQASSAKAKKIPDWIKESVAESQIQERDL